MPWCWLNGEFAILPVAPECAPFPYPTMQHFVADMCTCVHISLTKCCIVGYLSNALRSDLWDGTIWYKHPHCLYVFLAYIMNVLSANDYVHSLFTYWIGAQCRDLFGRKASPKQRLIVGHLSGTIGAKFPYNFWVIESFLCTTVLHYTVHILLHIEFVLFPNSELGTDGSFSMSLFTNDRYNFLKGHNQALIILINGLINVLSSARYHCSIWTQTAKKKLFESQYKYFLSKLSWDTSYVSVKWPCWTLSMFFNKLCRSSGILILPKWYPII